MHAKSFSPRDMGNLAQWVVKNGRPFMSERGKTYEVIGASLVLNNPLNRIDAHRYRRLNLGFAIAEWLGMLYEEKSVMFYSKFVHDYGRFSSDGVTVDGAYGPRIHLGEFELNAVESVINMLKKTPESRRAVITIYNNLDLIGMGGLNTPCTVSMQFLVRRHRLHMLVNMRSNDIHYGLTNDVIVFTLLQEYVARQLGVELGPYHHYAGSLHVYDDLMKKFGKKRAITKEGRWPHTMLAMPADYSEVSTFALYCAYNRLNADSTPGSLEKDSNDMVPYSRNLFGVGAAIVCRNNPASAAFALSLITDQTLRRIANFWVDKDSK